MAGCLVAERDQISRPVLLQLQPQLQFFSFTQIFSQTLQFGSSPLLGGEGEDGFSCRRGKVESFCWLEGGAPESEVDEVGGEAGPAAALEP